MAQQYAVQFVNDGALPAGQDWMLLEVDGHPHAVVRGSASSSALDDVRAAYRQTSAA